MKKFSKIRSILAVLATSLIVIGCNDARVASYNISKMADNFQVVRRVVFYNGITDSYMLSIEGNCSIKNERSQLSVTCKDGPGQFKKHYLGLSDNISYFVEQIGTVDADIYHYKVLFKPSVIIPDIDVNTLKK